MFDCQSLFTSVPGARIGRRIKGGMPLLQILGSEVDWRHIRHCKDTERYAISGKRGRRKTAKKKKKKKDRPTSLTERSVKVLPEKIMPAGLHFRGANGDAA